MVLFALYFTSPVLYLYSPYFQHFLPTLPLSYNYAFPLEKSPKLEPSSLTEFVIIQTLHPAPHQESTIGSFPALLSRRFSHGQ